MSFKKTDIFSDSFNPFKLISKDWFLLTSGNINEYNTMTASWGQIGILWNKPVFTTFVRTSRKTFELMEDNIYFTASFLEDGCRDILNFCGKNSGRDYDKAKETGLVPQELEEGVTFKQAKKVFLCRKLYTKDMEERDFIDKSLLSFYSNDPFHKAFIGEITGYYIKEK